MSVCRMLPCVRITPLNYKSEDCLMHGRLCSCCSSQQTTNCYMNKRVQEDFVLVARLSITHAARTKSDSLLAQQLQCYPYGTKFHSNLFSVHLSVQHFMTPPK